MIAPPAPMTVGARNELSMTARVVEVTYRTTIAAPTPLPSRVMAPDAAIPDSAIGFEASIEMPPVTVSVDLRRSQPRS
jgi:hypothetical protein